MNAAGTGWLLRAWVIALVLTMGWFPAVANSAPGDGGLPAESPTLSLESLGVDSTFAFYGVQGTQNLTVPVPRGLAPTALNVVVEMPPNLRSGVIAVTQDNRVVSRIDLPPADQAPISIPLVGAEIVDNAAAVVLRTYLVPVEGYCLYDPTIPLRLTNASVTYEGTEAPPATVAEFLPPVLQRLTIFLPEQPSRAESDAAVRLTATTVAHYGRQPTNVTVLPLRGSETAPPAPSQPLERQVVIRERPDSALTLQGTVGVPSLLITGPANDLTNQTRLLSSDISRLALASKAVVGPLRSSPQLPPDLTTIRDLGQPGVNAVALSPQVSIGLDQTRLGRSVRNVRVHLQGSYTPLPSSVAGEVVVSIGSDTVERWPTDNNGVIDRWVNVPDRLLQRYTNLGVAVNLAGNTGRCGEFQPVKLVIDGATVVTSQAAMPPAPPGFQSLPQAMLPRLQVGIADDAFADTVRGAKIIEGLQRLSALPMETQVVSVADALNSELPAVVVSAQGWDDQRVQLPVSNRDNVIEVSGVGGDGPPETLTLDPSLQFGSLQTVFDGKRTVVVATSTAAPAELDALLGWLDADGRRWSRLSGDAVLQPAGRDPVTVASVAQPPAQPADRGRPWIWWVAGATAAVAVLGTGFAVLVNRRRKPGG